MFDWFKKRSPERCVDDIINRYFDSDEAMSKEDYSKLKECLEKWEARDTPEFLGAMAYVRYREGAMNKMWDYIEKDLEMELAEEEHGAFIPAMMADVEPKVRYEILKKIHSHIGGTLSLEIMARLAPELGKEAELAEILRVHLEQNPDDAKAKKIMEKLNKY
ncbi:MAG: hypothetical protein GXO25_01820 [Euryarchaeota archaeon]|nr:hypothetical protein [Euryarchaeota archaeon]